MKKFMIGLAVACAAAVSQAATVNWSLTGVTASPNNAAAAGWVAYFLDGSTRTEFNALTADKVAAYAVSKATDSGTTSAGRTGVQASHSYGNFSAGDPVSGYVVLFDASSATAAKNYAVTTTQSLQIPGAGNANMSWAFSTTTGGWVSTAVPEPTTVALLALGFAAVGLKRKLA